MCIVVRIFKWVAGQFESLQIHGIVDFMLWQTHYWHRSLNVLENSTDSARRDVRKSNGSMRYSLNRDAVTSRHYRSHFSPRLRSPGKRNQSRRDRASPSCRRVDRTCFLWCQKGRFKLSLIRNITSGQTVLLPQPIFHITHLLHVRQVTNKLKEKSQFPK